MFIEKRALGLNTLGHAENALFRVLSVEPQTMGGRCFVVDVDNSVRSVEMTKPFPGERGDRGLRPLPLSPATFLAPLPFLPPPEPTNWRKTGYNVKR